MSGTSKTLASVRYKCIEEGDCLLWTGHKSPANVPRINGGSLRRVVYEEARSPLRPHLMVSVTCGSQLCLNPAHMKAATKSAVLKRTYETTDLGQRRARTSQEAARKRAKLDMDKAREIRASSETLDVLAERYGVDRSLISLVKRGSAWKDSANPFAGLGARP